MLSKSGITGEKFIPSDTSAILKRIEKNILQFLKR
jgi:hypothetical protein